MKRVLIFVGLGFVAAAIAAAQDTRHVTEPRIPAACTTLTARLAAVDGPNGPRLAEADEGKLDTTRIQNAIDACPKGQSVVLKPDVGNNAAAKNAFLAGAMDLRAGVTLVVDSGVTLFGSRNPRDYDITTGVCGTITPKGHGCRAILNGTGIAGAGVMGDGTIDGRGGSQIMGQSITWWDLAEQARKGGNQNNPRILILNRCDDFTLYRITLKDSPNFHVSYNSGDGFTAWGVRINTPRNARNTDGIDPGNSRNVTITHCFIHTGDDNVAIKAGAPGPTTQMTIARNHFYTGHGMSIGSETNGGASKIRVSDLTIDGADNGIRIKSNSFKGGKVHDIVYEDVCIRDNKNPIFMDSDYEHQGRDGGKLPDVTGIVLRNVRILGGGKVTLNGFDAAHRLGMQFDGVTFADLGKIKFVAEHADLQFGPGAVNFHVDGDDVHTTVLKGEGQGKPDSCQEKLIPFPGKISVKISVKE